MRGHEDLLPLEEETRNKVGDKRLEDLQGTSLRREEWDADSMSEGEPFSLNLSF